MPCSGPAAMRCWRAISWRCGAVWPRRRPRSLAGPAAAVDQPLGSGRADVHGNPQPRDLLSRPRDRAVDLSRPCSRDHHSPVARTRPVIPQQPGFPRLPDPVPLARFAAADDLRAAIGLWMGWLAAERRASAHTVAAYGRDLALFLDFLIE